MLYIAFRMFRSKDTLSSPGPEVKPKHILVYGGSVGVLSGFFGIGGGFLIVPALMRSGRLPIINAIGSSLVAVAAFGATTAASYAWSGLIDWQVAAEYIGGGVIGGWLGTLLANHLAHQKSTMRHVFATIVVAVASYMLWRQFYGLY